MSVWIAYQDATEFQATSLKELVAISLSTASGEDLDWRGWFERGAREGDPGISIVWNGMYVWYFGAFPLSMLNARAEIQKEYTDSGRESPAWLNEADFVFWFSVITSEPDNLPEAELLAARLAQGFSGTRPIAVVIGERTYPPEILSTQPPWPDSN